MQNIVKWIDKILLKNSQRYLCEISYWMERFNLKRMKGSQNRCVYICTHAYVLDMYIDIYTHTCYIYTYEYVLKISVSSNQISKYIFNVKQESRTKKILKNKSWSTIKACHN